MPRIALIFSHPTVVTIYIYHRAECRRSHGHERHGYAAVWRAVGVSDLPQSQRIVVQGRAGGLCLPSLNWYWRWTGAFSRTRWCPSRTL